MTHKNRPLLCLLFLILFSQSVWADHLPSSEIARSKPEHTLAGVNVYGDKIESVIQRLGKADKITDSTNADYPSGSGERSYEWNRGGIRARIGAEFYTDKTSKKVIESAPMIVDVWGEHEGLLGRTGRGVSLGGTLFQIMKVYGPRLHKDLHRVTIQWKDETTLVIDLNSAERIVHMQLLAATE
jgi:hypothetical protein